MRACVRACVRACDSRTMRGMRRAKERNSSPSYNAFLPRRYNIREGVTELASLASSPCAHFFPLPIIIPQIRNNKRYNIGGSRGKSECGPSIEGFLQNRKWQSVKIYARPGKYTRAHWPGKLLYKRGNAEKTQAG
jgi:hypothetical protein